VCPPLDVLDHPERLGKRVLVIDDEGTRYSAGVTELLVENGHEVHVLTRWNALFHKLAVPLDQPVIYANLFAQGLTYTLNAWVSQIRGTDVDIFNLYTAEEETLSGFDSIVLCIRHLPQQQLYFELKNALPNVHRVGDCVTPRRTDHAIFEGFLAGREIFDNWKRYIEPGSIEQFKGPLSEEAFL